MSPEAHRMTATIAAGMPSVKSVLPSPRNSPRAFDDTSASVSIGSSARKRDSIRTHANRGHRRYGLHRTAHRAAAPARVARGGRRGAQAGGGAQDAAGGNGGRRGRHPG